MGKTIKSIAALKDAIGDAIAYAVDKTADEAKKVIKEYIEKYYMEYTPTMYERTYKFLNSLLRTSVERVGDGWQAKVYLDTSVQYFDGWTVLSTADAANRGYHGVPPYVGMSGGIRFWDEAMAIIISPEFKNQFADFLRAKGLNVV